PSTTPRDATTHASGCSSRPNWYVGPANRRRRFPDPGGGGGKWLAHRLETNLPGLSTRLHHGLREGLDGRAEPVVTVVDEVLGQVGDRLWVGYKRAGVS
uniref:hypothetical protein n=1 Tax=Clavibacter michiganensis TaxID=28447 RepID=UPI002931B42B